MCHTLFTTLGQPYFRVRIIRTIAIPLWWSFIRIKRGTAKVHFSCPIYIQCTSIRTRVTNKRQLKLTTLDIFTFLHYLLFTRIRGLGDMGYCCHGHSRWNSVGICMYLPNCSKHYVFKEKFLNKGRLKCQQPTRVMRLCKHTHQFTD